MRTISYYTRKHSKSKKGQAQIFISQEWFSKTLLSMGEAVIATDRKGTVTSMNKLAEELTGWSLAESSGKPIESIFDAINEQTYLPIENPINKALNENRAVLLANHTILIKKDKTKRYIVDSAVPLHNDDSELIGGALIFRDVTEQSLSQKKLLEKEGVLSGIMNNTHLVIYIKDLEGKYLLINRQKEKVYNINAKMLIGKNSASHLTQKHAGESRRTDAQAVNEKRLIEYEQDIQHADGTHHSYHTSKFPLYDSENKVYAVCAVSTDISESKKNIEMKEKLVMQEIILKSKIQYDELTKHMPNMFFSLDRSFLFTSFNKACERFTGKKAAEVIGKTMDETFPDASSLFLTEHKQVMESGKAKNFVSTFTFRENKFVFTVNIYPTENGISVLMTDLTKQKKSEMETLELVERLQEKNKDLRQFAYTVSHDLRAPIINIMGLANLFKSDPELKIDNRSLLENVTNEIKRLDNVVKDMTAAISAPEEGKHHEYITFEMELDLIKKVLANEIDESKAVITTDFKNPPGIFTVKSYLYSIMYNLLSNAIKYRSHKLLLAVHLQTSRDKEFICFSVRDNGMGIDMDKNGEKVFGLFNRFHDKEIEGRGIGLNLVKAQTESLGGKVAVESKVNHGSTFKVFFPANHIREKTA